MEFYDLNQIHQLAPLVAVNLGEDDVSNFLKICFDRHSIRNVVWDNSMLKNRLPEVKYNLRYFESESTIFKTISSCKYKGEHAHTINSPFNPESDLYPNGILSSKWFDKYNSMLPFAVISVHHLNPNRNFDGELGATLAAFRSKYLKFGVRYVAMIVSDGDNLEEENSRVTVLRQISELSKDKGLFYLNTNPQHFQKDCEVLVTSILTNLKQTAVEFYTAIETRIRQRSQKYYTLPTVEVATKVKLTPKILEVRNLIKRAVLLQLIHPNSVDYCLPVLENAYEELIDLLRSLEHVFFSPSLNSHDSQLYRQYRSLLDVIAIHLIRGYLSIEEPIAALRKHMAHIDNVLDILHSSSDAELNVWEAIQYQWLAELMCLLPKTALTGLNYSNKQKAKNNSKGLVYCGGILFHDNFYSQIITDPGLLFSKAAAKIELATKGPFKASYFTMFPDLLSLQLQRISLLIKAEELLLAESSSEQPDSYGLYSFLNWQLAEAYENISNDEKAIYHYSRVLSGGDSKKWGSIEQLVLLKIVNVLGKLGDSEAVLRWISRLFSRNINKSFGNPLADFSMKNTYNIALDSGSSCLKADVLAFNKSLKKEYNVFDTIVFQISLQTLIKDEVLKFLFPGSEITVKINTLDISMTDNLKVILHGSGSSDDELELIDIENNPEPTFGGLMKKSKKVIQFEKSISSSGWFGIECLRIQSEIAIKTEGLTITYTYNNVQELSLNDIKQLLEIVHLETDGSLATTTLMTKPQTGSRVFAKAYKPDVKLIRKIPTPLIIAGENFSVPFLITHKSSAKKLQFTSVAIEIQGYAQLDQVRRDDLTIQTNWELLKDDQPIDLLEFLNSDEDKCNKTLHVCVRGGLRLVEDESSPPLFAILTARIIVKEMSGKESIYDLDEYRFHVAMTPFKPSVTISPASDSDGNLPMPNPFILDLESENVQKYFSMPLPLRTWVVKATIDDYLNLIKDGHIEISLVETEIKSDKTDAVITKATKATIDNGVMTQHFTTESIHRFPHRNLNISIVLNFDWKRPGSDFSNKFETKEIRNTLPLQDPRVLMQVEAKASDKYRLFYTIENPTPRILTFTAVLNTELAKAQGTSWMMDDLQTVAPPKQTPFPVLPFSQFVLEYTGTFSQETKEAPITLPQLQVYDVNYKVSLPTLPIDEHLVANGTKLVLRNG